MTWSNKRLWLVAPFLVAMPFMLGMRECGGDVPLGGECAAGACGPALGVPSITCWDGSIGGNTGVCRAEADGTCGWEIRDCPAPPDDCTDAECGPPPASPLPTRCERGDDMACHWVLDDPSTCTAEDCGPAPGTPTWTCPDGSIGGFTGRCEATDPATGACGWVINDCPMTGDCSLAECGPSPDSPACTCADGTIGCNTDRCLRDPATGTCGWEWRECPSDPTSCGGWTPMGSPGCDEGFFCAYTREDICGAADAPGTCQRRPTTAECDAIDGGGVARTVCGCDGNTYASECHAWANGTSASADGACGGGADCDISDVLCDSLPPTCPSGQVPTQVGACYGPCVPVSECRRAACASDADCGDPSLRCVMGVCG